LPMPLLHSFLYLNNMRLLSIFLCFVPLLVLGQSSKEVSVEHLQNLKNGALLVRLPTAQNKIKSLLDIGLEKQANKVAREQQLENIKVFLAFKSAYDFSKVYFFYNLSSESIQNGNFKGHLLNENLEPDPNVDYSGPYYIAEFDVIQTTGLSALVIKDKNFNLLQKPFPYYAKQFDVFPLFRRSKLDVVKTLNKGLHQSFK
jgi:hypothetical protein